MEVKEIYCSTCKKKLGTYNVKYFSNDRLNEIISYNHTRCMREGHSVIILRP
ncbi:conserved protein of unknown function [Nitrosotalea devaniterrae]|uniref:Uncharacterized protein n=1 Tax=Nitrosotalea devaniterrae TaxID=1078905 RepID=A0A128A2S6_9ARCH|nr:conserved protein of unknown function [Candidatus Nitrosotalea devanaterra]